MNKVDSYREILQNLDEWTEYLLAESRIQGLRANIELARAVAIEADVCWIMRENLKKKRITQMDAEWVSKWMVQLS